MITEAQRQAKKRYMEKHGDRVRAERRAERAENPAPHNERTKKWREENREKVAAYRKKTRHKYSAKPESVRKTQKKYRDNNREKVMAMQRAWKEKNKDHMKEYRRNRLSEYAAHAAKRRAKVLLAMPSWCELTAIEGLYALAKVLTEETGAQHEIDHIVPLQSPRVCGLHCLANLQILEMRHNQSKGNRHWPDM